MFSDESNLIQNRPISRAITARRAHTNTVLIRQAVQTGAFSYKHGGGAARFPQNCSGRANYFSFQLSTPHKLQRTQTHIILYIHAYNRVAQIQYICSHAHSSISIWFVKIIFKGSVAGEVFAEGGMRGTHALLHEIHPPSHPARVHEEGCAANGDWCAAPAVIRAVNSTPWSTPVIYWLKQINARVNVALLSDLAYFLSEMCYIFYLMCYSCRRLEMFVATWNISACKSYINIFTAILCKIQDSDIFFLIEVVV
jgi:hypothetical protein